MLLHLIGITLQGDSNEMSQHIYQCTVELQWLEHVWNHENMFETGLVRTIEVNHSAKSGGLIRIFFFIFLQHKGMLYVLTRIASLRQF